MRGRFNDRAPGSIINLMDEDTVYSHRNTLGIKDYDGGKRATANQDIGSSWDKLDIFSNPNGQITVVVNDVHPGKSYSSITITNGSSGTKHQVIALVKN